MFLVPESTRNLFAKCSRIYGDFLDRGFLLTRKLLTEGFLVCGKIEVISLKGYVDCYYVLDDNGYAPLSGHVLIHWFVTRVTRRVLLMDQEQLTLPEYRSSSSVFGGIHVAQYLVVYAVFCRPFFVLFVLFSFDHCIVCTSSIFRFRFHLWYHPTFLREKSDIGMDNGRGDLTCNLDIVFLPNNQWKSKSGEGVGWEWFVQLRRKT